MQTTDRRGFPRIVITGMGAVTPLGLSAKASWDALLTGMSGVARITLFDPASLPCQIAGEVKEFVPGDHMSFKEARRMSRASQLAVAAAQMAIHDAGLDIPMDGPELVGTVVGTAAGGMGEVVDNWDSYHAKGLSRVSPFALTSVLPNMPSHHVSLLSGAQGPISTVVAACATGTQAIGEGAELIRHGRARKVIAGGVEATIHEVCMAGFSAMRALSTAFNDQPERASRPFDKDRDGFILSEGAGIVILERLDDALARGAYIYAEYLGHASSSDAFHVAAPDPEGAGAVRAMRWALEDAGVATEKVDYINAHGSSTPVNDMTETLAIKKLFGEKAYSIPVSSSKSLMGHAMGATGAIEGIFCAYALQHGIVPPTWNYETPDPECDLDYVPNTPRKAKLKVAMSNSFGLGGQNACLVLGKYSKNGDATLSSE